jgi:hypothetical protein
VDAVHREDQVRVKVVVADQRRDVRCRVPVLREHLLRTRVGRLADVPRTDAGAAHPHPLGQPGPPQVLAEHQRGDGRATDVPRADEGHVHAGKSARPPR